MNVQTKKSTVCVACSVALMGLLLFLGSCGYIPVHKITPTPSATPTEFLVHIPGITEPAELFPCHHGKWDALEFGMTTEEQLVQWLSTSDWVHQASLGDGWREPTLSDSFYKTHSYSWLIIDDNGIFRNSVGLDVISGTLSSLRTTFFYPLSLGEITSLLGAPESVDLYLDNRYEECAYSYEFYYLTQGITVGGSIYDNALCQRMLADKKALLEATWLVTDLSCSRGGTAEEVVGAVYGLTLEDAAHITKFLQPWSGFGQKYLLLE